LPRPLLLGAAALFTLLLSACGTVTPPANTAGTDMDRLLKSQPGRPSAVTKSIARREIREDPSSGLRVDLGPAAILAAEDEERAAANNREARMAAGSPTDPLRPDATLNLDDSDASKDLWARVRQGFQLPPLEDELVGQHERYYASRPEYVQRMTSRANRYLYHVVEEIERRGMPAELALLPFIESAFNPQATSSARASGIWQFMPATGKHFDLTQNIFRDERRDVLASTRAALDYLQRLHRMFGDWHLALAAYNWGEGNVQRAIKRNLSQGLPTDYASLNMPAETRHYVPKLHAVRNIVAQPEAYNLALTPIENHPYFVSVPIQRDMDVALAARLAALPVDEFKALNPSQNKPVILAAGTPQVLLPYDNAHLFVRNLTKHKGPLATWTAWQVPKTMRPADVAKQLGMPESTLREVNRIPPKMLVKAGSTLLVHRSEQRERDVSEALADNAMMALAPDVPPLRRMTLKAGKRDTVRTVAKRYGVSVAQVASWNNVGASARFKRGEQIVVYVPNKGKAQASRSLASAKKGRVTREAKLESKVKGRKGKTVVAVAKKGNAKARAGASSRNAKVRVASAR
jgi:membrane-bound lytic murein transglycosylase D